MKRFYFQTLCALWMLQGCLLPASLRAGDGYTFSINVDNDLFSIPHTDRHYTQGLRLQMLWPDEQMFSFLRSLPDLGIRDATHKVGLAVSQEIYTPEDLETSNLITNDRPYAGWLFVGFIHDVRGVTGKDIPTRDRLELDLGIVGQSSLAGDAQNWWHGIIHVHKANGWAHQVSNEPGLLLRWQRRWLICQTDPNQPLVAQLIPEVEGKFGNVETSLGLHAMVRLGHNITDDFSAKPVQRAGWYLFSKIGARAVGYNIFLDGPLFVPTPLRVDPEHAVVECQTGLVLCFWEAELSYTWHLKTKEFRGQDGVDTFASLNLACRF